MKVPITASALLLRQRRAEPGISAFRLRDQASSATSAAPAPPHAAPLGMLIYHRQDVARPRRSGDHDLARLHRVRWDISSSRWPSIAMACQKTLCEDVVSDWLVVKGSHPQGAAGEVSIDEQDDGSILVTEDHNGALLRLARSGVGAITLRRHHAPLLGARRRQARAAGASSRPKSRAFCSCRRYDRHRNT